MSKTDHIQTYEKFEDYWASINLPTDLDAFPQYRPIYDAAMRAFDAGLASGLAFGEREAKRLLTAVDMAVTWNGSKNRIIEKLEDELAEAKRRE